MQGKIASRVCSGLQSCRSHCLDGTAAWLVRLYDWDDHLSSGFSRAGASGGGSFDGMGTSYRVSWLPQPSTRLA